MAKKTPAPKFETREQWLLAFTRAAHDEFTKAGAPLKDIAIRVSVGFPSKGARSNVIGECWHAAASEDKAREVFIRPSLQSDVVEIAGVLTHELIHAALPDGEGHGKLFGKAARGLGLEGKLTSTSVGAAWHAWADPIIADLGPFPGAKLGTDGIVAGGKKKQGTRMLKVFCPECGWHFRTSQQNIDQITDHTCLACGEGQLTTD